MVVTTFSTGGIFSTFLSVPKYEPPESQFSALVAAVYSHAHSTEVRLHVRYSSGSPGSGLEHRPHYPTPVPAVLEVFGYPFSRLTEDLVSFSIVLLPCPLFPSSLRDEPIVPFISWC